MRSLISVNDGSINRIFRDGQDYWEPSQDVSGLEDASVEPSIWYGAFDVILL